MATEGPRDILPPPERAFDGTVGTYYSDSVADVPALPSAPYGAPNVLLVLLDDVGFGHASTFGGPVDTPTLQRLADGGLRYNRFHTTALCSPTRAAILSGRNHHSVHTGCITELSTGFPGYDGILPKNAALVAETLQQNGYNTAAFGKWHNTPDYETSPAGPFDRWPTGLGFEYFWGFLGGETNNWNTPLVENITPIEKPDDDPDWHLCAAMADKAIDWIDHAEGLRTAQAVLRLLRTGRGPRTAPRRPHSGPTNTRARSITGGTGSGRSRSSGRNNSESSRRTPRSRRGPRRSRPGTPARPTRSGSTPACRKSSPASSNTLTPRSAGSSTRWRSWGNGRIR